MNNRCRGGILAARLLTPTRLPPNPQGSSAWEELSPRATEEGIAERRPLVRPLPAVGAAAHSRPHKNNMLICFGR